MLVSELGPLFHYQRFVELYLVSLLADRKVKFSKPNSFNDPWDCRLRFHAPTNDEEAKRLVAWLTEMNRKHSPEVSEAARALKAHALLSDRSKLIEMVREVERRMYAEICARYRVYCLTENPCSALMWSHYSGGHTGICLEFGRKATVFTMATKVNYRVEYPAYDVVGVGVEPLVTKSRDWAYEEEWRLIAEERASARADSTIKTDDDFLSFRPGVLQSITIGYLADENTRRRIRQLVSAHDRNVLIRQAQIAPDRYEVMIDPPFSVATNSG